MKIHSIHIKNFKGFEDRKLDFGDQFTLLAGDNGSGKTGMLDAIAVGLGGFLTGIPLKESRHIDGQEVHVKSRREGGILQRYPQFPVEIECAGTVSSQRMSWIRSLQGDGGKTTKRRAKEIKSAAESLASGIARGEQHSLPLMTYYGTQRLWLKKKRMGPIGGVGNRFDGYQDCLDRASNHKHLEDWLRRQALIAAQKKRDPIAQVQAIENAVVGAVRGATRFYYDLEYEELRIELKGDRLFPFEQLSAGYRNTLGMIADIAWRACVLNPQYGVKAPERTEGVVLIDELDLHLHPKWQRLVVLDLKRTFPEVQFIASSHSPFIIQSIEDGELRSLDPGTTPNGYAGKSPEDIVESVMGVELPQRSDKYLRMMKTAEQYFALLEESPQGTKDDLDRLERKLDELTAPFSGDAAYNATLKREFLSKRGDRE